MKFQELRMNFKLRMSTGVDMLCTFVKNINAITTVLLVFHLMTFVG